MLQGIKVLLIDCDGVLWRGKSAIQGVTQTITEMRSRGIRCVFLSNNNTKHRSEYPEKLRTILNLDVSIEDILTAGFSTSRYLQRSKHSHVYVFGSPGLRQMITEAGCEIVTEMGVEKVSACVVGMDRDMSFGKLTDLLQYLLIDEVQLVVTNNDGTFPDDGKLFPGTGACVGAVRGMVPKKEVTMCGKPSPALMDLVRDVLADVSMDQVMMVGDRLSTDIAFGNSLGCKTCLVLTGVSKFTEVSNSEHQPDVIIPSINELIT